MNTIPTYRRGRRRVYHAGPNDDRGGCAGVCSVLFLIFVLAAPPIILFSTESLRYGIYATLSNVLDSHVMELSSSSPDDDGTKKRPESGDFVHATSSDIRTDVTDADMKITVPGAMVLKRRAEYCQWQEFHHDTCDTCTRNVREKDGSVSQESYSCNCARSYHYVKGWRSHIINSLLFDRPAAHHNPVRDPLPSTLFVSDHATLQLPSMEITLTPAMLQKTVRGAKSRPIIWTANGIPPEQPHFWSKWIPNNTRYEPTSDLAHTQPYSRAAQEDKFVYVGNGYFFSPNQSGRYQKLFQYFMEYVEGSLLDWQVGDIMPSCTPGDVRVSYEVQDPLTVSILGEVDSVTNSGWFTKSAQLLLVVKPKKMTHGMELGLVHAGRMHAEDMIAAEDSDSWKKALGPRLVLFLWSAAFTRILAAFMGRDMAEAKLATKLAGVGSLWCAILGLTWIYLWGVQELDTVFVVVASIMLLGVVVKFAPPRAIVPGGFRATWNMLLRWAQAPPSWRARQQEEPAPYFTRSKNL